MHIIKKISHISNSVGKSQYVKTTYNASIYENSQKVLGWTKYSHGLSLRSARALAKSQYISALQDFVTPMAYSYENQQI